MAIVDSTFSFPDDGVDQKKLRIKQNTVHVA